MSVFLVEFFAVVGKPPGQKKTAVYAARVRWDAVEDVVVNAQHFGWTDVKHVRWVDPLREGAR